MIFNNNKRFICCSKWKDVPSSIRYDTILELTNIEPEKKDKKVVLVVKRKHALWVIGDDKKTFKNISFVLESGSSIVLDSLNLQGTKDDIPFTIEGNNCIISARNRSSITPLEGSPALILRNNAKGLNITVEDAESSLLFCGANITYNCIK